MKIKYTGISYINNKPIHRMIVNPKDYRPLCLHFHETAQEALECKHANENLELGIVAPFPKEEKKHKKA